MLVVDGCCACTEVKYLTFNFSLVLSRIVSVGHAGGDSEEERKFLAVAAFLSHADEDPRFSLS